MHKTSIISILKSLNKTELKEFDKFIISPYFNNQPSLSRFYEDIKKFYPEFTHKKLERELVFQRLYPGKQFSDDTIRRLSSDLKKVLDDFIYYKASETMPAEAGFLKVSEYIKRGLIKEAEKELEQIDKQLTKSPLIGHGYIHNKLEHENLLIQMMLQKNRQDLAVKNFFNETEYLVYNFILRLTYSVHNLRVNKLIFNSSENQFTEEFISSIDFERILRLASGPQGINRAMRIYLLALQNNINETEEKYFFELKELLPAVINDFTPYERYSIYQIAEALCWRKMELIDRERYRRELFELNRQRMENGVYSPDGKNMRLMLYRQALMTSLQVKEFDWAERFAAEYSSRLPAGIKDSMQKFAEAHILFEKEEYERSLSLVSKIDFEIFTLKYDLRNLLMRIYIELNYMEEAISLIDSYKRFIKNNKNVSEYYKTLIHNFLKYCKLVLELRLGKEKLDKDEILRELDNENTLNFKLWLRDKIVSA